MTMTEDGMPSMPLLKCENCSADNPETQKFCSACSFPINGSDQEKSSFRLILSSRKRFLADAEKKIENGKLTIYALAGLFFILVTFSPLDFENFGILRKLFYHHTFLHLYFRCRQSIV